MMVNIGQRLLLKCDLNFGLPVLVVVAIVHSLWASSYFFVSLTEVTYTRRDDYLLGPMRNTYYLLCLSASVMLYYGFKNADKNLIRYWHLLKLLDCGLIITGIIIFSAGILWSYLLVAIPILSAGWYIHVSIKQGYRELGVELDPISVSDIYKKFNRSHQNQDNPLSEVVEKTQENLNPLAANTLRFWGFIKIIEFVIIFSGAVFVVSTCTNTISGSLDNWNMFWIIAGLGLCFTFCVKFVWAMIPKKLSDTNTEQKAEELAINLE